jgi:methyltransferase (TIGR00027 family)
MNPVSHTAYYCCGTRMMDANSKAPLCNDIYAHRFMDEHGHKMFAELRASKRSDVSCAMRSRIVEDYLREHLVDNADQQIVLIGAGFDSKAYRIKGGSWVEIDEAPLIELKNERLPVAECPNPLTRRAVDFSTNDLSTALGKLDKSKPTIFVIEGVLMYLSEYEITVLLATLAKHFPRHTLICDLMNRAFMKMQMQPFLANIARYGCSFKFTNDNPEAFMSAQKYRFKHKTSVVGRTVELKGIGVPSFIIKTFYPQLLSGYSVCSLDYHP